MNDGDDLGGSGDTRPDGTDPASGRDDLGATADPPAADPGATDPGATDPAAAGLPTWTPPAAATPPEWSAAPPGYATPPAAPPPPPPPSGPLSPSPAAPAPPPPPASWSGATGNPVPPDRTADPTTWVLPDGPPTAPADPTVGADRATAPAFGPSGAAPPPPPPPNWTAPAPTGEWSAGGPGQPPPAPAGWAAPLPAYAGPGAAPPLPPGTPVTKGRSRAALAILSVTAILAASTFAFVALTRPDGAGSAEEAVEQLFAAIDQEDAIGVLESLPPGERDVLLDPMVETVGELQRLGILDSFALDDVPGADIEVDGLTLESTNLGDGVTKVRVTGGTITGTVIPDEVPIGPRTRDLAERNGGEPIDIQPESDTQSLADADLELVAIEEDGGWHVSLFYTIAEAARGDDTPLPQFGGGLIEPLGSDSPEGAVRGLMEAGLALDLRGVVGHLPPDEMRVLYDYVPLFLDDADDGADELRADGYEASLDRLDLHAEGDGTTRRVTVDALDVSGGADGTSVHYAWDGDCTVMELTSPGSQRFAPIDPTTGRLGDPEPAELSTTRAEVCTDGTMTVTEDGEEIDDISNELGPITPAPFGRDATFGQAVTVVEHDGLWYVSPVRTVADSLLAALRSIDGSDIDEFFGSIDDWFSPPSERFDPVGDPIPGNGGTIPLPDPNDPYSLCSAIWYDDLDLDASIEDWDAADEGFDQCLRDHGEEPYTEPERLSEPRVVGTSILALTDDGLRGYDLDGVQTWELSVCDYPSWAAVVPGLSAEVDVVDCGDELVAIDAAAGTERWRITNDMYPDHTRVGTSLLVRQDSDLLVVTDLATGAERWSLDFLGDTSVASDDTAVYIGTDSGVGALDLLSNQPRWSLAGRTTGLGLANGVLIARSDQHVVQRIDPATGDVAWTSEVDHVTLDASDVIAFSADTVIFQSTRGTRPISAYDLATGDRLWVLDDGEDVSTVAASPTSSTVAILAYPSCTVDQFDQRGGPASSQPTATDGCANGVAIGGGRLVVSATDEQSGEASVRSIPVG